MGPWKSLPTESSSPSLPWGDTSYDLAFPPLPPASPSPWTWRPIPPPIIRPLPHHLPHTKKSESTSQSELPSKTFEPQRKKKPKKKNENTVERQEKEVLDYELFSSSSSSSSSSISIYASSSKKKADKEVKQKVKEVKPKVKEVKPKETSLKGNMDESKKAEIPSDPAAETEEVVNLKDKALQELISLRKLLKDFDGLVLKLTDPFEIGYKQRFIRDMERIVQGLAYEVLENKVVLEDTMSKVKNAKRTTDQVFFDAQKAFNKAEKKKNKKA